MWRWLTRSLHELDREAAAAPSPTSATLPAAEIGRARQVLIVAAVVLALAYGFGDRPFFESALALRVRILLGRPHAAWFDSHRDLLSYTYWALCLLLCYAVLPALHLRRLGIRLRDAGLRWPRAEGLPFRHVYLLFFLLLFPVLLVLSRSASFQQIYPFYRDAARSLPELIFWELLYASTFFAVEFFFRGYLLFALLRPLGSVAVFVSALPYCLIHMGKPAPELLGSIVAGILLGTLALRSRSILGGVGLHVAVALSMDLLSLWQAGRLAALLR